jgi:hypothetical protein
MKKAAKLTLTGVNIPLSRKQLRIIRHVEGSYKDALKNGMEYGGMMAQMEPEGDTVNFICLDEYTVGAIKEVIDTIKLRRGLNDE